MSTHSVAEAKNHLPELIDRALKGESVVITRHGAEVLTREQSSLGIAGRWKE